MKILHVYHIERAIASLIHVNAKGKCNVLFKVVMCCNLGIKMLQALGIKIKPISWPFSDTIINVRFKGYTWKFYCPKGYDYNIYLIPYYHEYDVHLFVSYILREGDVFIDVGAHGGSYTLLASKLVGVNGKVIAIEPNPINLKFLEQNVQLNKLKNIIIIPKAISDRCSRIKLYYREGRTALTSIFGRSGKMIEASAVTLDEITSKINRIRILKIDTEGNDFKVLKGGVRTLRKTDYVIIEQNDLNVRKFLHKLNFAVRSLFPSHYLVAVNKSILPQHQRLFCEGTL